MDEQFAAALEKYTAAVDQDDTNCDYLLKRSACYTKLGRFVGLSLFVFFPPPRQQGSPPPSSFSFAIADALVDANTAMQQNNTLPNVYVRQG